jgi:acetyl-CoA C-acetyltransferase|tara:strand:- start:10896 stop:12047 length:1152 start_codon:yes stop_codon:yes gene_type:complete
MGISMGIYIKGAGMTKFDVDQRNSHDRIYECVNEAFDSGNIGMGDVEAIFVSNCETDSNGERQKHVGPMLSSMLQKKMPIITVPAGCGGGGAALWNAIDFHKKNDINNILVIGFEKLVANRSENITDEMFMGGERIYEQAEGMIFPAQNALVAQQYMIKYGATLDDLALVSLKNHENAFHNPKARFYKKKITLDMIKKSPIVASPLRLFDCSIPSNGAASVIISKDKTDIEVTGSGLSTSNLTSFERQDMTSWDSTINSAKDAYSQSGITAKDIDIVEIHDAFTPVELISYEDLGFCKKGDGANLIREGITKINGTLPVNTSGGLKAKGHPISATGISQIYELVLQLRGQAEKRQVDNIKYGLAHNIGGAGSITSAHILKKAM